jgi:N-acetylglucosaminyldiphosphoundecaprenol N-acetyl-beta-D-mannosaminyltransferase
MTISQTACANGAACSQSDLQYLATQLNRLTYSILGLPIDAISMAQAVAHVEQAVLSRQRCFISTPNVNFAIAAQQDFGFRRSVLRSDLVLADGQPLVWISKVIGVPITERVSGASLFEQLLQRSSVPIRVYFFGGPEGAAQAAHEAVNHRGGSLQSVGYCSPGFVSVQELSEPAFVQPINDAKPDFIVVALGAKKGQEWILANLPHLDAPVISHLGAVVNFTAGTVQRAPAIIQFFAAEWLWRIYQEPQLWRRYWTDGKQLLKLLLVDVLPQAAARLAGQSRSKSVGAASFALVGGLAEMRFAGYWSDDSAEMLRDTLLPWVGRMRALHLDARDLQGFSPRIHAMLLQVEGADIELKLINASPSIRKKLARIGCGHWCTTR